MDKETLLAPRAEHTEPVPLPDGGTVTVRGLNRVEAIHVAETNSILERDRRLLAAGMVEPKLSEAEVGQWQKVATGGEIEKVSEVIARLSRMLPGADKSSVPSIPEQP